MSREETKAELTKLNGLLHDHAFAIKMAAHCEAAYTGAANIKQNKQATDIPIKKWVWEEKTAACLTNLYAVECSTGAICQTTGRPPSMVLKQIAEKALDSRYQLLLNAFAGAAQQAATPFMGLHCIQQSNGIDIVNKKDPAISDSHAAAARWLLLHLHPESAPLSTEEELIAIEKILKDKALAEAAAAYLETTYDISRLSLVHTLSLLHTATGIVNRSAREENIAINLAGFYALVYGLAYLSAIQKQTPSRIVEDILCGHLSESTKDLLERFANATWKAGQPFRGLDRITRDVFGPFDRLFVDEVKKDWQQIKAVAELLAEELTGT